MYNIPKPIQPYHFQANLILCDGTWKSISFKKEKEHLYLKFVVIMYYSIQGLSDRTKFRR
jgi:hypothetical protein